MSHPTLNVLFVCEANSIRSIMAEAILNRFGGDRFTAFSAGFEPAAELHPLTVEMAQASGAVSCCDLDQGHKPLRTLVGRQRTARRT